MSGPTLGVDIGGTKIAAGILDRGQRTTLGVRPTVRGDGHANASAVRELIARAGDAMPVGLSVTTTLDAAGAFRDHSNWLGWSGWTARDIVGAGAGPGAGAGADAGSSDGRGRVVAANDALCGAIAEDWAGDAPGRGIVCYVTLGTGIAHTTVIDGIALAGAHGAALFTAWTPAGADERSATWEELAAGPALARSFDGGTDARPLAAAAANGDERARAILEQGARWFGTYLATLIQTYDPHRVIVGGGLASGLPTYVARATQHARAAMRQPVFRDTPILPARLGGDSGWIGAALLVARDAAGAR